MHGLRPARFLAAGGWALQVPRLLVEDGGAGRIAWNASLGLPQAPCQGQAQRRRNLLRRRQHAPGIPPRPKQAPHYCSRQLQSHLAGSICEYSRPPSAGKIHSGIIAISSPGARRVCVGGNWPRGTAVQMPSPALATPQHLHAEFTWAALQVTVYHVSQTIWLHKPALARQPSRPRLVQRERCHRCAQSCRPTGTVPKAPVSDFRPFCIGVRGLYHLGRKISSEHRGMEGG